MTQLHDLTDAVLDDDAEDTTTLDDLDQEDTWMTTRTTTTSPTRAAWEVTGPASGREGATAPATSNADLYAAHAPAYWAAGWRAPLPLPPRHKASPPNGYTGREGTDPSYADVMAWSEDHPDGNIALRLPRGVLGIDVDNYGDKGGLAALEALEARHGALPPTWSSSSRTDGSGIRLYRAPEGLHWPGGLGPGIDVIQYRHRYVVAPPSIHPNGGTYRWTAYGTVVDEIPTLDELSWLPEPWVLALSGGQTESTLHRAGLTQDGKHAWLDARLDGHPCERMTQAAARWTQKLLTSGESRHDTAVLATRNIIGMAGEGHPGSGDALDRVIRAFNLAMDKDPTRDADDGEIARMIEGAVDLSAHEHPGPPNSDPCDLTDAVLEDTWTIPNTLATTANSPAPGPSVTAPETSSSADASSGALTPVAPTPAGTSNDPDVARDAARWRAFTEAGGPLLIEEYQRQQRQRTARTMLDDEEAGASWTAPTWLPSLADDLVAPRREVKYRVDGLWPAGSNVVLTAAYKSGKTTTVNDLVRSVVDGAPFLGHFAVTPTQRRVAVFNYEVEHEQYVDWLREVDVTNTDKITVLTLRGLRLPLISSRVEDWVVAWLKDHDIDVWCVDPFARAAVGSVLNENDNSEVGRFLDTLDVIKHRAGVSELIMPAHTGRGAAEEGQERARGATRLDDWADVRWLLNRGTGDAQDSRFFRATGRDVEVEEGELEYDEHTRRSTFKSDRGRKTKAVRDTKDAILEFIENNPGASQNKILNGVTGRALDVRNALEQLVLGHFVGRRAGTAGGWAHYRTDVRRGLHEAEL